MEDLWEERLNLPVEGNEREEEGNPIEEALERVSLSADSVRWFLNEIGKYPLLTLEEEVDLGRKIKEGKRAITRLSEALDLPGEVIRDAVAYKMDSPLVRKPHYPEHFLEATRKRAYMIGGEVWKDWHRARVGLMAHEELVRHNLRLVVSVAKNYGRNRHVGMSFLDHVAEGVIGLMIAADKFDWEMGTKFSTYAMWWIRQAIQRGAQDKGRLVRIPAYLHEEMAQAARAAQELRKELGKEPSPEEVARKLGGDWTKEKVEELARLEQLPYSLDAPMEWEDGRTVLFGESIASGYPIPEEVALKKAEREAILRALGTLDGRRREVVERRFGLNEGEEETLEEIGKTFGVSRERIRQLEKEALDRLRRHLDPEMSF